MVPGLDKLQFKEKKSSSVFNSTDDDNINVHSKMMQFYSKQLSKDTDIISNVSLADIEIYLNRPEYGYNEYIENISEEIVQYFSQFFTNKLSTKYGASYLEIINLFNKFKSNPNIVSITGSNNINNIIVRIKFLYNHRLDIIINKKGV